MNYTDGKGGIVTKVLVRCLEFHLIIILNRLMPVSSVSRNFDYIIMSYKN